MKICYIREKVEYIFNTNYLVKFSVEVNYMYTSFQ